MARDTILDLYLSGTPFSSNSILRAGVRVETPLKEELLAVAVLFAAAFFVPMIFLPFTALFTISSPVTVFSADFPFTSFRCR